MLHATYTSTHTDNTMYMSIHIHIHIHLHLHIYIHICYIEREREREDTGKPASSAPPRLGQRLGLRASASPDPVGPWDTVKA